MDKKYLEIFNKYNLAFARLLGSKSLYRDTHPDHLVVFNARIYLKTYYERAKDKEIRDFFKGQEKEIWYGDLDLNKDVFNLWKIHMDVGEALVVTSEMGNKIVEIGDKLDRHWVGLVGNKGITLKQLKT